MEKFQCAQAKGESTGLYCNELLRYSQVELLKSLRTIKTFGLSFKILRLCILYQTFCFVLSFSHFSVKTRRHKATTTTVALEPGLFNLTRRPEFQPVILIFLNTGLCFSFITAESEEELRRKAG